MASIARYRQLLGKPIIASRRNVFSCVCLILLGLPSRSSHLGARLIGRTADRLTLREGYMQGLIGPQVASSHLDETGFRGGFGKNTVATCDLFALLATSASRPAEAIF